MASSITTQYKLGHKTADGFRKVVQVKWDAEGQSCIADLEDNGTSYIYTSKLGGDTEGLSVSGLSLADCTLAANVHLGLIPTQQFDRIACDNGH